MAALGHEGSTRSGALIGLVVGVVLVGVVLWLPAALAGGFYEFSDPLIFMGLPMITISAVVEAPRRFSSRERHLAWRPRAAPGDPYTCRNCQECLPSL